ncbi:MAG: hypothetical protein LBT43_08490 [Prevotella sp.]|jgi:AraC-like DNA-binding protein|nr:hypothetical protein [Prevotella sp.]
MELFDLLEIISYAAPPFSALICLLLLGLRFIDKDGYIKVRLSKLLMLHYGLFFYNSLAIIFFIYIKPAYAYISLTFFFTLILAIITFYRIVFIVTCVSANEKFPRIHYILLVILTLMNVVYALFIPLDVHFNIVTTGNYDMVGSGWQIIFYTSKIWLWILYSIVYTILAVKRIGRYRKSIVDYSADEERSSLRWLYTILATIILFGPLAFISYLLDDTSLIKRLLPVISNLMAIFQNVLLCYNMFTDNYVIILPEGLEKKEREIKNRRLDPIKPDLTTKVDKTRFEKYIKDKKPYLNPALRITDMAADLGTNRTYLSLFINTSYRMNFNNFINSCRIKEMDMLSKDPAYTGYKEADLAYLVGFNDFRSFIRIRQNYKKANNADINYVT